MSMDHDSREQQEIGPFPVTSRGRDTASDRAVAPAARSRGTQPAPIPFFEPSLAGAAPDMVVLSHLRWDLVFQRPQHLLTRCASDRRVYFVEEPIVGDGPLRYSIEPRQGDVKRVVFHLPHGLDEAGVLAAQRELIDALFREQRIRTHVLWYYTPMALPFTRHLKPAAVVYDCMDELSAFAGAPPALRLREAELLSRADLVLTGGQSLYEAKRALHPQVHAFPSSVDVAHFARARQPQPDPADQAGIPRPRIGFFGVLDERLDIDLVRGVADARPDWHLVLIGPVVKIDPAILPQGANLHYLGPKTYQELPRYLSAWDVALLPFARNEATRFISPTKTPEYLAAGCPVVSTSIRDVVRPYGQHGLARIADTVPEFVAAIDAALRDDVATRRATADAFLSRMSWDDTWARMRQLVDAVVRVKQAVQPGGRPLQPVAPSAPEL
jgi:UDP-galactopyranose mutase